VKNTLAYNHTELLAAVKMFYGAGFRRVKSFNKVKLDVESDNFIKLFSSTLKPLQDKLDRLFLENFLAESNTHAKGQNKRTSVSELKVCSPI